MTLTRTNNIFTFGSNEAGIHGAGAALYALQYHGAIYGQGVGLQGNAYGIPTKDHQIKTLPLEDIQKYVDQFLQFARDHSELTFKVTPIGTGLAGYSRKEIAPMFRNSPDNVSFCDEHGQDWIEKLNQRNQKE